MALGDEECRRAAIGEWRNFLERFDWDGAVLDPVGWYAAPQGPESPETYTPFHPSVREAFRAEAGFDPVELFDEASGRHWKTNPDAFARFERFRESLGRTVLREVLTMIADMSKKSKKDWEVIATWDPENRHSGISAEFLTDLKREFGLLIQRADALDPPNRTDQGLFDLFKFNVTAGVTEGEPFYPGATTSYPTGAALYSLIGNLIREGRRFSLESESAFYEVDMHALTFLNAMHQRRIPTPDGLVTGGPESAELMLGRSPAEYLLLDGKMAGSFYRNRLLVPAGEHEITLPSTLNKSLTRLKSKARLVDFSGNLLDVTVANRGIEFQYLSDKQAFAVLSEKPRKVKVDGRSVPFEAERGLPGWSVALPKGEHLVSVTTRGLGGFALASFSYLMSYTIVLISVIAIAALGAIFVAVRIVEKRKHEGTH